MRGSLTKIVPFETKHFVPYLKHVRYLGCSLLGGFTAFIFLQHVGSNKEFAKYLLHNFCLINMLLLVFDQLLSLCLVTKLLRHVTELLCLVTQSLRLVMNHCLVAQSLCLVMNHNVSLVSRFVSLITRYFWLLTVTSGYLWLLSRSTFQHERQSLHWTLFIQFISEKNRSSPTLPKFFFNNLILGKTSESEIRKKPKYSSYVNKLYKYSKQRHFLS